MNKSLTKPKTITIITASLAVLMLASIGSTFLENNDVLAQTTTAVSPSNEKTIAVTGTARTSVSPDLLTIQFGVETQEKTAKQALDANSLSMNKIVESIKSASITADEIKTSGFSIYPVYEGYQDPTTNVWKQNLVGYRVSNIITVETAKLNSAAAILDGAVAAGANRVDSVSFGLSPEQQLKIQDELIGDAVLNAQKKAENALVPLKQKIIGVKMVSLSEFAMPPPPMPMYEMAYDSMGAKSATPIFSSDQDITTTANVVFIIGN